MILTILFWLLMVALWGFGIGIGIGLLVGPFVAYYNAKEDKKISPTVNKVSLVITTTVCWTILIVLLVWLF